MQKLQFNSVDTYFDYSIRLSNQFSNMKLNTIRKAMAAADGFSSIQAYCNAIDSNGKESSCFMTLSDIVEMVFLTSGCCENAHGTPALMERYGLEYQAESEFGFYPLTESESKYIAEDYFEPAPFLGGMMAYSVLYNGQKYQYLDFRISFEKNTKASSYKLHCEQKNILKKANDYLQCALIAWEDNPTEEYENGDGEYASGLLVPFSQIPNFADSFSDWKHFLNKIFIAANLDQKLYSKEDLASVFITQGQIDYHAGKPLDDCPHSAPTYITMWKAGWANASGQSQALSDTEDAQAESEGWCLSFSGTDWRLEKIDDSGKFSTDKEAWDHVVSRANNGSELHIKALGFLKKNSPVEYHKILKRN